MTFSRAARALVLLTCSSMMGCGHGSSPVDFATDAHGTMDMTAAVDQGTDLEIEVDDMKRADMDVIPPPDLAPYAVPSYAVDGTVSALLHTNNAWYVGGAFTRITPYAANDLMPLDTSGNPVPCNLGVGFDGPITTTATDGTSLYVGGYFTHYNGATANRIAKLDPSTCALDTTFSPATGQNGFDEWVATIVFANGSLYVGGSFLDYRGAAAWRIAKLDTAGNLDTTFIAGNATPGFDNNVLALAASGTSIYAGGTFTKYRGVANSAAKLAKLDLSTGNLDTTFSPPGKRANGFSDTVASLATSANYLYVGGYFDQYNPGSAIANRFARLSLTDGTLDTTFSPQSGGNGFDDVVLAILPAADDSVIYLGGAFTQYQGVTSSAIRLAKLDSAAHLDATFSPPGQNGFGDQVDALLLSGSSLYVGGAFSTYRSVDRPANAIAKLDATTGAMDTTFVPAQGNTNGFAGTASGDTPVTGLVMIGSTLWVGGSFTAYGGYAAADLVKIDDTTWKVDTTFSPATAAGFDGSVAALATDGTSLYVGGNFTSYDGITADNVAKLDPNTGAIDGNFAAGLTSPGFDEPVTALVVAGTSLYAGGYFDTYDGVPAANVAKLNLADGTIDATFSPPASNGFNGGVNALAADATSLYASGTFTMYEGVSATYLAKLDLTSGALDTSFSPTPNGFDSAPVALSTSGTSLYAGGLFTEYRAASPANNIAKLATADGTFDTVFDPAAGNGFDGEVSALAASGTSLYAGGPFTTYRGVAGSATGGLAKLDASSGTIDTTFATNVGTGFNAGALVNAIGIAGNVMAVGGTFTTYNGAIADGLVFLDSATGLVLH